jgi:glycosyltransferase involved in cell wall biosynthesis
MLGKKIIMLGTAASGGIRSVIDIYSSHPSLSRWNIEFIATHREGSAATKLWAMFCALTRFLGQLARGMVLVAHVHQASRSSTWRKFIFVCLALAFRCPVVLHVHGGMFADFYHCQSSSLGRWLMRWTFRRSRFVVALSEEWRAMFVSIEPRSNVVVIPNPVEVPAWQASLMTGAPTALFLGVLNEAKGVKDLIQVWPDVLRTSPLARLILCGSGNTKQVREWIDASGVAASIDMPGWVRGAQKEQLMRDAWVFVLPSHIEALPMSILEAMAAGVPVVACNIGGIPMAVISGETGFLIEPHDRGALAQRLTDVLGDAALRIRLGIQARHVARERFSAAVVIPMVDALWTASSTR